MNSTTTESDSPDALCLYKEVKEWYGRVTKRVSVIMVTVNTESPWTQEEIESYRRHHYHIEGNGFSENLARAEECINLLRQVTTKPIILLGVHNQNINDDRPGRKNSLPTDAEIQLQLTTLVDKAVLDGSIITRVFKHADHEKAQLKEALRLASRCVSRGARYQIINFQTIVLEYLQKELVQQEIGGNAYNTLKNIYINLRKNNYNISLHELQHHVANIRQQVSPNFFKVSKLFHQYFNEENTPNRNIEAFNAVIPTHDALTLTHLSVNNNPAPYTQKPSLKDTLSTVKKLGLLDVDKSIIIDRSVGDKLFFGINKNLIEALKKDNIRDVCFFTNMRLTDMDFIPVAVGNQLNYITRRQLIDLFAQEGIRVHAVITQADVGYQQGCGRAFFDFYLPAYEARLANPNQYEKDKRQPNSYSNQYNAHADKLSKMEDFDKQQPAASQKKLMFLEFMKETQELKLSMDYYDDDATCLKAIQILQPQVTIHHITDQESLPLFIPGEPEFKKIIAEIEEEKANPENNNNSITHFKLFPARLPKNTMCAVAAEELMMLVILYQNAPEFQEKVNIALYDYKQSFKDFVLKQQQTLSTDPETVRRQIFSLLISIIEKQDQGLYQQLSQTPTENRMHFSIKSTEKTVFEYFPQLMQQCLPNTVNELKTIARSTFLELEVQLANEHETSSTAHQEITKQFNEISSSLKPKTGFHLFGSSHKHESAEESSKLIALIAQMSKLLTLCATQPSANIAAAVHAVSTPSLNTAPTNTSATSSTSTAAFNT